MSARPSRVQFGASKGSAELWTTCRSPGLHVEDLEPAADVVAVGHEALAGRADEAHVAEDGALHHVGVVRAQEQPHVHVVAEGEARRPGWS